MSRARGQILLGTLVHQLLAATHRLHLVQRARRDRRPVPLPHAVPAALVLDARLGLEGRALVLRFEFVKFFVLSAECLPGVWRDVAEAHVAAGARPAFPLGASRSAAAVVGRGALNIAITSVAGDRRDHVAESAASRGLHKLCAFHRHRLGHGAQRDSLGTAAQILPRPGEKNGTFPRSSKKVPAYMDGKRSTRSITYKPFK